MNGFINLYKDEGITSNKALNKVKAITRCKKAGFLGTLDPGAVGVLPVGLGFATKLFPYIEKTPKTYHGEIILGAETDTQDSTGKITKTGSVHGITSEKVNEAFKHFLGEIEQLPPMYSAKKVDGIRLYKIARKGGQVKRELKKVTIYSLDLEETMGERIIFNAKVSMGTYIRTLCEDIGRHLGVPAHMGKLTRSIFHIFTTENSWTIKALGEAENDPSRWLLPLDYPLGFMVRCDVNQREEKTLKNGVPIDWRNNEVNNIRLYDNQGKFFGIGRIDKVIKKLIPLKLMR